MARGSLVSADTRTARAHPHSMMEPCVNRAGIFLVAAIRRAERAGALVAFHTIVICAAALCFAVPIVAGWVFP